MYSDIIKRKKEQRKKWQAKYLQKLGVTDTVELENSPDRSIMKEEEPNALRHIMRKTDEKYHRPVTSSTEKRKEEGKKKGMDYAQYK